MKLEYGDIKRVLMDEIRVIETEGEYMWADEQFVIIGIMRAMRRIDELDDSMMEAFTDELL